jgi:hypothetical protein
MEMRSVRIIVLGIVGLTVALLFPAVQSYVLLAMAVLPFIFLVIGQLVLPRSRRIIRVWFNPIILEIDGEIFSLEPGVPMGRLSGRDLVYGYFKQWHEFTITTHRFLLLAAIGLISLVAAFFAWKVELDFFSGAGFYYLLFFSWLILVGLARRWLWERRMLRLEGLGIGSFRISGSSRPIYAQMLYHFVDPEGHYRGGSVDMLAFPQKDDMTIVFYDEENPDRNIPASALIFHKLLWKGQALPVEEQIASERVSL